jgi:hypothetical protein
VPKNNVKNVESVIRTVAKEAMTEDTKVKTVKVDALSETTVGKTTTTVGKTTTATAEIGIVQNVRITISHSELNATAVEKLVALVEPVEDVVLDKTTGEAETKDTRVETVKVDALNETTVGKTTTATAETGIVQNVRITISHSELNAIAVEKLVVLVEDVVLDKTTGEVEAKAIKVETVKVDALSKTIVDKTTATAEIGTVQNAEIIISHSELNVTHVDFLEVVEVTEVVETIDVAEMTDTAEMTDVVEMIAVEKQKSTPITIGIVQNVKTQTSHSVKNVIAAKHLALAPVAVAAAEEANVEMMVDDHLVEIAAEDHHNAMTEEHLDAMMAEDLLDAMTVDDLHNAMTVLELLEAMMVGDHHSETMVQDLLVTKVDDSLVEMAETEEVTVAAIKAETHTVKVEHLNASQENLETLENHKAMDLGMHITAHRSLSSTLTEMIERGMKRWVLNITILTP